MDPKKLSDTDLFTRFKTHGKQARINLRVCGGLLPELARRGLHRARGYGSIYELAAKHAMMSRERVDKVLRLDRRFASLPRLRSLLENGTVGWSKLEVVSGIATPATDDLWAHKVTTMTKRGLEAYVRALKKQEADDKNNEIVSLGHSPGGVFKSNEFMGNVNPASVNPAIPLAPALNNPASVNPASADPAPATPAATWSTLSFKVSPQTEFKFRQYKQTLEKAKGMVMTFNEVLESLIENSRPIAPPPAAQQNLAPPPPAPAILAPHAPHIKTAPVAPRRAPQPVGKKRPSRHIPHEVRRQIEARCGGRCEFPSCRLPGEILHHTRRFVLNQSHDPDTLRYLCHAHERVAHATLIAYEESAPAHWRVRTVAPWWDIKTAVDKKVAMHRRE